MKSYKEYIGFYKEEVSSAVFVATLVLMLTFTPRVFENVITNEYLMSMLMAGILLVSVFAYVKIMITEDKSLKNVIDS